jgi:hypothetical protein
MKKTSVLLAGLVLAFAFASQSFAVSEAGVLFLLISPGARAAGMGESFAAVAEDATASYWNPGGLAFQTDHEVTLMHCNWLPQLVSDMSYEFLAYRQYVAALGGTVGGNITFLNLGEQVQTGEDGPTPIGTFRSWDGAVTLSYATKLKPNLGLGVNARYIRSNLAPIGAGEEKGTGVGSSFAIDIGVLYKPGFLKNLGLGLNLSNMGPKITYIDAAQADPLPTNLRLGLSYRLLNSEYNRLILSFDTNKLLVVRHKDGTSDSFYKAIFSSWSDGSLASQMNRLITSCGAEYGYNDMIFLRAGYYYDYEGNVKYPTFGAGLMYAKKFRFDFAYVAAAEGHPLSDTMRFSLTAGF